MTNEPYTSQIAAVLGSAPEDLVNYYSAGDLPDYPESRIHCLPFDQAKDYTLKTRGIPAAVRLGLWMLDDANDSNPFAFVSTGPCQGMILHFSHDAEPAIKFMRLGNFLASMHEAGSHGRNIDEVAVNVICLDLSATIRELLTENTDDATWLLTVYLPISKELDDETLARLSSHEDFLVRESFASFLLNNPSAAFEGIARHLAADKIPQVARKARAALNGIRAKKFAR